MKVKPVQIVTRVSILSLITVSIMYGTGIIGHGDNIDIASQTTYNKMSTRQLQIEVERLSQNGELPFPMGLELIERWSER